MSSGRSRPSVLFRLVRSLIRLGVVTVIIGAGVMFVARRSVPFVPFAKVAAAEIKQGVAIRSDKLAEISGCAVSTRNPGVLWVHNDSGDGANLYAVRLSDGTLLATVRLSGVKAVDWEDMALSNGRLFVGDIGDNGGGRKSVQIHSVDEPRITASLVGQKMSLKPTTLSVSYESGPRDAEALLVDPDGNPLIIDKLTGGVWKATGPGPMHLEATLGLSLVTGADLVPGGGGVLIRTYPFVYRLKQTGGTFSSVWTSELTTVSAPLLPQAEAVCASPDGTSGYTLSEARGRSVRIVRIRW